MYVSYNGPIEGRESVMGKSYAVIALAAAVFAAADVDAAVVKDDTFTYANGPLTTVSAGTWANHSGTALQVDVAGNAVNLTGAETEDVNTTLSGAPYTSGTLYAGLDFNLSALPAGTGNYFAHFKDTTNSGFRGRVFATIVGAGAGTYRIGIADTTASYVTIATDLSLNSSHRFVVAINTATGKSTLYLDSPTETGGLVATDATTALAISTFAFRQSIASGNSMGTMVVDNLKVATTYAETAIPEPTSLALLGLGCLSLLARRRKA